MDIATASRILRAASGLARPIVLSVEPLRARTPASSLYDELYQFSNQLSNETRNHWQQHVDTCNEVHLLRDAASSELVGFQLWRFGGIIDKSKPIVWGGKLRFCPTIRRAGVHLMLNLVALNSARSELGAGRLIYRVGLVNIHGFLALQPALASSHSPPLSGEMATVIGPELRPFCEENAFVMHAQSGRVDVGQVQVRSPDTYSEDWWAREAVNKFRRAGMGPENELSRIQALDRQNDAFLCWEWDESNVTSMHKFLLAKMGASPSP